MRGKDNRPRYPGTCPGITPAYAGKRISDAAGMAFWWDHPRVCREKLPYLPSGFRGWGSPPRMRGKALGDGSFLADKGITPAYAGKSRPRCRFSCCPGDYPRVCGEKLSTTSTDIHPAGSPPRVRGKEIALPEFMNKLGITPACAGKSYLQELPQLEAGDHPRVCGEKAANFRAECGAIGSPPRVRGKGRQ